MPSYARSTSSAYTVTFILLLLVRVIKPSYALFTQTTRWGAVSIQRNSQGTFCYVPASATTRDTTCKGSSADLASVLQVHLVQGLSIAYYNGVDNVLLGGSNYSLPAPANMPIIRLCVSGRAGDGGFETLCVNAAADNQLSGSPLCQVVLAQQFVSDGCYDPRAFRPASLPSTAASYYTAGYPNPTATGGGGYPTTVTSSSSSEWFEAGHPGFIAFLAVLEVLLLEM
ncbi:hypothetical protein CPB83DRAFT_842183 [Crepidotus variabilis]|uniref:FAS1 domain-containing protein n=1 Tax=Crepidotus variabilis TaxID=179855 RepID=A0A9P6EUN6_9AGAR|nr:hypothetical protein CPB83DRAFT_842183 [Crepidotus variabilis]